MASVALLTPVSTECQCWVAENVMYQDNQVKPNGYTPSIRIDFRFALDIVQELIAEGFLEGEDFEVEI